MWWRVVLVVFSAVSAPARAPTPVCHGGEKEAPWLEAWRHLDRTLRALPDGAPLAAPLAELGRFMSGPCFAWARFALGDAKPDSATSLRTWWIEDGGAWLESAAGEPAERRVTFPPDFRPSLFLEGHAREDVSALLCPASDARCGAETRGWLRRAQDAFDQHDDRYDEIAPDEVGIRGHKEWREAGRICDAEAAAAKDGERAAIWRACIDGRRPLVARLPVGRFRAPSRGWLVVAGRRGHYQFCDGIAAYDLVTGSAAAARSCGGLALANGGLVDGRKTDVSRKAETETGTVSVDNLRELALALVLLDHTGRLAVGEDEAALPPRTGVPAARAAGDSRREGTSWMTSGQTHLTWRWIDGAETLASGELRTPDSSRAEEAHADHLLEIVEAGLSPGCPRATPPVAKAADGSGSTSWVDAPSADQAITFAALRHAFEAARTGCSAPAH